MWQHHTSIRSREIGIFFYRSPFDIATLGKKYRKTSCHTTPPSFPSQQNALVLENSSATAWSAVRSQLWDSYSKFLRIDSLPKRTWYHNCDNSNLPNLPISMLALSFWRSSTERWSLRATRLHSELTSFSAVHTDLNSQAFMPFLSKLLQKKVNCDKNPK